MPGSFAAESHQMAITQFEVLNAVVIIVFQEEQWYSEKLRKEVERLSSAVQRPRDDSGSNVDNGHSDERLLFESQVAALEEAKAMRKWAALVYWAAIGEGFGYGFNQCRLKANPF